MAADPVAEELVGHPDLQGVAVAAEPQLDTLAEPEPEPRLAQPLRHRRAKRRYLDVWMPATAEIAAVAD